MLPKRRSKVRQNMLVTDRSAPRTVPTDYGDKMQSPSRREGESIVIGDQISIRVHSAR